MRKSEDANKQAGYDSRKFKEAVEKRRRFREAPRHPDIENEDNSIEDRVQAETDEYSFAGKSFHDQYNTIIAGNEHPVPIRIAFQE